MKVYTKPEIEVEEMVLNISILAGTTGDWGATGEEGGGPEGDGDDGPAPTNMSSIWED